MNFDPSINMVGNFTDNDGTIDFYLRVNSLINKNSKVLDFGAGRAAWYEDDKSKIRRMIRLLKGKVREVIAADIDDAVLKNKASNKQILITNNSLNLLKNSFDLIIADYVLEHIDDPKLFYKQIDKCLKSGGWFCARTPHKYCYVSIFATLFKNSLHSKLLKRIQPERKEIDVFPTKYKMNTMKDITKAFEAWENKSFIYKSEPDYYFGNKVLYYLQSCIHKFLPVQLYGNLFIFVKKP